MDGAIATKNGHGLRQIEETEDLQQKIDDKVDNMQPNWSDCV